MSDSEIAAFVRRFEECTLPRSEWTHARHLILALWYLTRYPREEATQRIRAGIQRFNLRVGNRTGYHETITLAWIAVIARFLAGRDPAEPLSALAAALLEECGRPDYLLRFYSEAVLRSDEARAGWVAPDRAGLA